MMPTDVLPDMAWSNLGWRAKAARQNALLWVLAIATEKQLPLADEVDAIAAEKGGMWGRKLHQLAELLRAGASLPDSIEQTPGVLPRQLITALRVGAESGTLAPTLRMLAATSTHREETYESSRESVLVYLLLVMTMMFCVTSFLMYYIVPKFKKIFEDFGTELPATTILLIQSADFLAIYFYLPIILLLVLVWITIPVHFASATNRIPRAGPFRLLPFIYPRVWTAGILRVLAIVVRSGKPLSGALSTLGAHHHERLVRERWARVSVAVDGGAPCWVSMADEGLLHRKYVPVLEAAERVGNLPWALEETATRMERQWEYRLQVALELLRPVGLLLMAVLVGFVAVGMFLPLVKLLNDLS